MRTALALAIFAVLFLSGSTGFAEPRITARLSQNQINTSQSSEFLIQAEWPRSEAQYQFALPNLPLKNLKAELRGQSQETYPGEGGEWTRKIFTFLLTPQKPGNAEIQAFSLPYIDPALQKGGTFEVPAQKLTVRKPGPNPLFYLIPGAFLLAVTGVVVLMIARRKKKAVPEPLSPAKAAGRQFQAMLENADLSRAEVLPEVGRNLRSFLEITYGIQAAHATETELLRSLEQTDIQKEELSAIRNILTGFEEIKYVGRPTEAEYRRLRSDLLRFIHSKQVVSI